MTENFQPIYKLIPDVWVGPCLPADDIKMGDMVFWDTANKKVRALNGDVNVATLLGVSKEASQVSHHNQQGGLNKIAIDVMKDKTVRLKIAGAEAIDNFTPVYWGGDAQTITTVQGANTLVIGHIMLNYDEGDFARTTTAGERVYVQLVRSYVFAAQLANL